MDQGPHHDNIGEWRDRQSRIPLQMGGCFDHGSIHPGRRAYLGAGIRDADQQRRQRHQLGAQKIPIWKSHPLLGEAHASVHIGGYFACLQPKCDAESYCGCRVRPPGRRCSCSGRAERPVFAGSGLIHPACMWVSRPAKLRDGSAGQRLVQRHLGQSAVRRAGRWSGWRRPGSPARCSSRCWHPGPCDRTACACCRRRSSSAARIVDVRGREPKPCGRQSSGRVGGWAELAPAQQGLAAAGLACG